VSRLSAASTAARSASSGSCRTTGHPVPVRPRVRGTLIIPPQALSTEITPFGVRAIDVHAAEECASRASSTAMSTRPPSADTAQPDSGGFAGEPSELDPARLDASAWIERLPVIRDFRAKVLGRRRRSAAAHEAIG